MMTGRKQWWRAAAIAVVGGSVVAGGWFGLVRAKGQPDAVPPQAANWAAPSAPAPVIAEVNRTPEIAPATGPVTPASATLPPIPMVGDGAPVVPAVPAPPPPVTVSTAALPLPAIPAVPPVPSAIEPVAGPRTPDPALTGGGRAALPVVPPVPSLPPAQLPDLPVPPKPAEVKPVAPAAPAVSGAPMVPAGTAPGLPPLPGTAEPPKAPMSVPVGTVPPPVAPAPGGVPLPAPPVGVAPTPTVAPAPGAPGALLLPQPAPVAPSLPPVKPADPVQSVSPVKPDSDLKPINPGNTLNPTVAPAVPVAPMASATGREAPAAPTGLPKPTEPSFNSTDQYVFPVKPVPDPRVPHLRDEAMLNLTTTAAFAFLGGAILAVEKANIPSAPVPPSAVSPAPAFPLRADEKTEVDKLKSDLVAANEKIKKLEDQVKALTDLVTGKRDGVGVLVDPTAPGAVEEIKRLKDKIATLEGSLKEMKSQTTLRPALVPEVKPRGTVRIVNEYPVEISMVVNDKSYRVAPNTKLDVEVTAGDFTYQLLQSGAAATKSVIKEKETVTLRIK